MAVFEYRALNEKGRKVSGIVNADSLSGARDALRAKKLFPVDLCRVTEKQGNADRVDRRQLPDTRIFSGISSLELAMVTRLLSTLLTAGFPLVRALSTVAGQTRSRAFQKVLSQIKNSIEEGSSFSEALTSFPHVFSPVYVNMVAAGESSGTLEIVLDQLADVAEKKNDTRKKIQAALAYPIIMSITGFLVLVILLTYIVPGIVLIFSDMNQTLPLPTQILIRVSDFFVTFWWVILLTPILVTAGIYFIRRTEKGRFSTDWILIHLPVAGNIFLKLVTARFSRTLGSLLENGVPMLTSLKISQTIASNLLLSGLIKAVTDRVEQGETLGTNLMKNRYFPELAAQMIQVGEKSGEIEKMLEKTAELFEKEVQSAISGATALVEPVIILVMGAVVGLIVLSICLPIMEINQLIL